MMTMMMRERIMIKQPKKSDGKAGRKEKLTLELAKKIAAMVRLFPDANIDVTWNSVIEQVNQRYGLKFHRNTLAQKEWDGNKLIAIAFEEAEEVQKRLVKENAPKYADNSRSSLRKVIAKLQAENLVLREQQAKIRAQQFDEVHSLLDLRTPLHRLMESRVEQPLGGSNEPRPGRETALSLVGEKASTSGRKAIRRPTSETTDD